MPVSQNFAFKAAPPSPVLARMEALGPCSDEQVRLILAMNGRLEVAGPRVLLQSVEGRTRSPRFVLAGWACLYQGLHDGRRQLIDLVLPGEGIAIRQWGLPAGSLSAMALTRVETADASRLFASSQLSACPELAAHLKALAEQEDQRRLSHILRLGRLSALERLAHLLLEIRDRLVVVGQAEFNRFPLPITQEVLGDMLGLSVVHVNRTVQDLGRRGLVRISGGIATLIDPSGLEHLAAMA